MVGRKGIRVVATKDGLRVEAEGFSGPSCESMLEPLLRNLGINPGEAQPTESYWSEQSAVATRISGKN